MVEWLERQGFAIDICTDLDIHDGAIDLSLYKLAISVGHDEYWTEAMRTRFEDFIASGGNVAFFSGNICWWQTRLSQNNTLLLCDKPTAEWWRVRPENALTGVSYRNGGGRWTGERPVLGFQVQNASHWIYEGTGLSNGDVFGNDDHLPLIGYEFDGVEFEEHDGVRRPTGADGTPKDFLILAISATGHKSLDQPQRLWEERRGIGSAAMGIRNAGEEGTVFTAATTDWVKRLSDCAAVECITLNVIKRLST